MKMKLLATAAAIAFAAAPASADTICEWMDYAQLVAAAGAAPADAPRTGEHDRAATQAALAMFEAVNAIDRRYESYVGLAAGDPAASQDAAAATAAYQVMLAHFPGQKASARWARDFEEIKRLGGKVSTDRTAQQSLMARYRITPNMTPSLRLVADAKGRSLVENARMFAIWSMVQDDALMATGEAKLHYNFWRPITSIRNAEEDGNPATAADPAWEPLIATPNHPEYPCAHCSTTAAMAEVLKSEVGKAPPGGVRVASRSIPNSIIQVLPTLDDWVREVSISRTYGGVHYRFSNEAGEELGRKVAEMALAKIMRPLPGKKPS